MVHLGRLSEDVERVICTRTPLQTDILTIQPQCETREISEKALSQFSSECSLLVRKYEHFGMSILVSILAGFIVKGRFGMFRSVGLSGYLRFTRGK
jgi:hypothetical protein